MPYDEYGTANVVLLVKEVQHPIQTAELRNQSVSGNMLDKSTKLCSRLETPGLRLSDLPPENGAEIRLLAFVHLPLGGDVVPPLKSAYFPRLLQG